MCVCTYACTCTNYIWIRACRHIYIIHMNLEKYTTDNKLHLLKKHFSIIYEKRAD